MSDLIERQDAIDALMSLTVYKSKREVVQAADKHENTWIGGVAECIDEIEDLPSAQQKGKWIATKEWGGRNYSCSCCNFSFMVDTCMYEPMWNFCPNCGAEMTKGESDG